MKRNKILRTAAIILALVLISTCGMVGTLAKYVKEFKDIGADVVRAGYFEVIAGDGTTIDFTWDKLSLTVYDGNPHAVAWNGEPIIVPGYQLELDGTFPIVNLSEVDVTVEAVANSLVITGFLPDYLLYSANGTTWNTDPAVIAAGTLILPSAAIPACGGTDDVQFKLFVRWPFEDSSNLAPQDALDTGIGEAAGEVDKPIPADPTDSVFTPSWLDKISFAFDILAVQAG